MLNIGAHMSIAKGYEAAGKDALSIGANTFQFFTEQITCGEQFFARELSAGNDICSHRSSRNCEQHGQQGQSTSPTVRLITQANTSLIWSMILPALRKLWPRVTVAG